MKKLGKLSINPEKVLNNDELINLRGGYGGYPVGSGANKTLNCTDGTISQAYNNPIPCTWYPNANSMAVAVQKYCKNSKGTFNDC